MDVPLDDDEEELVGEEKEESSDGPVHDPFDSSGPTLATEMAQDDVKNGDHSDTESWATMGSAAD